MCRQVHFIQSRILVEYLISGFIQRSLLTSLSIQFLFHWYWCISFICIILFLLFLRHFLFLSFIDMDCFLRSFLNQLFVILVYSLSLLKPVLELSHWFYHMLKVKLIKKLFLSFIKQFRPSCFTASKNRLNE